MPKDLLLTNYDLTIKDGDFVVGESTAQHKQHLIVSYPGEFRQYPIVGVGIGKYLNGENLEGLSAELRRQFELDGLNIDSLSVTNGILTEQSSYGY
jgi:hypothetical protein